MLSSILHLFLTQEDVAPFPSSIPCSLHSMIITLHRLFSSQVFIVHNKNFLSGESKGRRIDADPKIYDQHKLITLDNKNKCDAVCLFVVMK